MPWIPLAILGASIYSADQQSDAVEDAARAQGNASDRAMQFQRNALFSNLTQGYPVYRGQINALNRLYSMQGMPSIQAAAFDDIAQPFVAAEAAHQNHLTEQQRAQLTDRARQLAVVGAF